MSAFQLSMLRLSRIAPGLVFFVLFGCSSSPKVVDDWPAEVPPKDLFIQSYENDADNQEVQSREDYLVWIKRFYQGWVVYSHGWLKVSQDILEELPMDQREEARSQIAEIGLEIAREWAKEKQDRYIFTNMVAVWGEGLLEALNRGEIFQYMELVEQDLESLKQRNIVREDISIQRYFPNIQTDSFLF